MTEKEYKKELKDKLIKYRKTLLLPKEVTFGVEIEYENVVRDTVTYLLEEEKLFNPNLDGWKSKSEIDITEYNQFGEETNGEVTSKILTDNPNTWQELNIILNMLVRNGAVATEKCGGHVNIGAHILGTNKDYWKNFLLLWVLYENEIYRFSTGEFNNIRKNVNFCFGSISSGIWLEEIIKTDSKSCLNLFGRVLFDKYHDVYITKPLDDRQLLNNRIEFRIPNGSLDPEIWQNYVNFFAKFILACKKDLDIDRLLYQIKYNDHSVVELANYIFDNDIDKENFLIQTLKTNDIYNKELVNHIKYY